MKFAAAKLPPLLKKMTGPQNPAVTLGIIRGGIATTFKWEVLLVFLSGIGLLLLRFSPATIVVGQSLSTATLPIVEF